MQKHESEKDNSGEESRPRKKMNLGETNDNGTEVSITPVMKTYFERTVNMVELPEKENSVEDNTYPGLILDGASGVGKTQQVFAILKAENTRVVYRLLVPDKDSQQRIYSDMRKIADPKEDFLTLADEAVKELKSQNAKSVVNIGRDVFSVEFLSKEVVKKSSIPLEQLLQHLYQSVLKYDKTSAKLTCHSLNSPEHLENVILFLDEVLPKRADNDALTRLRFLRNLGRALGMRVVMAGTAATAANMIMLPNVNIDDPTAASRDGSAIQNWMEIQFIYNDTPLMLPHSLNPKSKVYNERPWIASLLENLTEADKKKDGKAIIKKLGEKINSLKKFSDESKLIWLCGPWLELDDGIPTSPFLLKPADLVRGHFFEPGIATWKINDHQPELPYFGIGICSTKITMGNHRIALKSDEKDSTDGSIAWSCVIDKIDCNDENILKSKGFSGIHYCFSHCVQICLAKEPIMALCLSVAPLDSTAFKDSFKRLWQESLRPPSIDGRLNEFAMFAALQLASRSEKFMQTKTVSDTVKTLHKMLQVSPDAYDHTPCSLDMSTLDMIREFEYLKMPWLIPACSKKKLEYAFQKCGGMFTGDGWNIAGLVPGTRNSEADARAFQWDEDMTLAWVFEFKARSKTYSLSEGKTALEKKCKNSPEKDSHAMLIAVSGDKDSKVHGWLTDEDKLRVVLVVGCGYKQK